MGSQAGKMLWTAGVGGGEMAPPGGGSSTRRGPAQGRKAGVQILSGWGSGSGVCRNLLGSQGSVSPAGQVPIGTRKRHYSRPDVDKAPLSQTETKGPGHPAAFTRVEGGAAVCTIYRVFIIK